MTKLLQPVHRTQCVQVLVDWATDLCTAVNIPLKSLKNQSIQRAVINANLRQEVVAVEGLMPTFGLTGFCKSLLRYLATCRAVLIFMARQTRAYHNPKTHTQAGRFRFHLCHGRGNA